MEWEHSLRGEENEMKKFTQCLSHPQVRWENDHFIGACESEVKHYIAQQAMLNSCSYAVAVVALLRYFICLINLQVNIESSHALLGSNDIWVKWINHWIYGHKKCYRMVYTKTDQKNDTSSTPWEQKPLLMLLKQFSKWLIHSLILQLAVFVQGEEGLQSNQCAYQTIAIFNTTGVAGSIWNFNCNNQTSKYNNATVEQVLHVGFLHHSLPLLDSSCIQIPFSTYTTPGTTELEHLNK